MKLKRSIVVYFSDQGFSSTAEGHSASLRQQEPADPSFASSGGVKVGKNLAMNKPIQAQGSVLQARWTETPLFREPQEAVGMQLCDGDKDFEGDIDMEPIYDEGAEDELER
ncbi:hypothetical protein AMTR_s00020p00152810, partial [Amborella trichopoda]